VFERDGLILTIILILALFLLAYSLGKAVGTKLGKRVGRAEMTLELHSQCLLDNRCPICKRQGSIG
jgi:hypothetical protein